MPPPPPLPPLPPLPPFPPFPAVAVVEITIKPVFPAMLIAPLLTRFNTIPGRDRPAARRAGAARSARAAAATHAARRAAGPCSPRHYRK